MRVQAAQKLTTLSFQCWSKFIAGDTQKRWSFVAKDSNAHKIKGLFLTCLFNHSEINGLEWYRTIIHTKFGVKSEYLWQYTRQICVPFHLGRCTLYTPHQITVLSPAYYRILAQCTFIVDFFQCGMGWGQNMPSQYTFPIGPHPQIFIYLAKKPIE